MVHVWQFYLIMCGVEGRSYKETQTIRIYRYRCVGVFRRHRSPPQNAPLGYALLWYFLVSLFFMRGMWMNPLCHNLISTLIFICIEKCDKRNRKKNTLDAYEFVQLCVVSGSAGELFFFRMVVNLVLKMSIGDVLLHYWSVCVLTGTLRSGLYPTYSWQVLKIYIRTCICPLRWASIARQQNAINYK